MARPGLYDELVKLNLLPQGRTIALGDGSDLDKAPRLELLICEKGSSFSVSPRSVFILRHKLAEMPAPTPKPVAKAARPDAAPNMAASKPKRKPPPGPNKGSFKTGDPRIAQPGHDRATITGEYRNPLLHAVSPERRALVEGAGDLTPETILRQSIAVHQLAVADLTAEIEAIQCSDKRWVWLGSTYTRQEGDGELMGTGRTSQRKRAPREEALRMMVEARARVQARLDAASDKLHKMLQDTDGRRKGGLGDLLAALKASGDTDD